REGVGAATRLGHGGGGVVLNAVHRAQQVQRGRLGGLVGHHPPLDAPDEARVGGGLGRLPEAGHAPLVHDVALVRLEGGDVVGEDGADVVAAAEVGQRRAVGLLGPCLLGGEFVDGRTVYCCGRHLYGA